MRIDLAQGSLQRHLQPDDGLSRAHSSSTREPGGWKSGKHPAGHQLFDRKGEELAPDLHPEWKSYSSEAAAEHARTKYRYFRSQIETPEDFIRLCATKSLISGKPYLVVTPLRGPWKSVGGLVHAKTLLSLTRRRSLGYG